MSHSSLYKYLLQFNAKKTADYNRFSTMHINLINSITHLKWKSHSYTDNASHISKIGVNQNQYPPK